MKLSFSTVIEYVKELLPVIGPSVAVSDNPSADVVLLTLLSAGRIMPLTANNGRSYLYVFPCRYEDFELVKYVLRSNGLTPREHMSHYYYDRTPALRVSYKQIEAKPALRNFVRALTDADFMKLDRKLAEDRLLEVRKNMGQKVK